MNSIFLDRHKTLLPRIDSIYFLTRVMILLGFGWLAFTAGKQADTLMLSFILATYLIHLAIFGFSILGKFDAKLAYFSTIIYDLLFIPIVIMISGGMDSSLYLLYYLTVSVGAYVLRFWYALLVAVSISLSYLLLIDRSFDSEIIFHLCMRIGFLWVYFLALTYVSEYLRRSETRLLKLFDTLNLRTAELERSQARLEMIYENSRVLASILDPDQVIRELMRIMVLTLQYSTCAVIFRNRNGQIYYRARVSNGTDYFAPKAIDPTQASLIVSAFESSEAVRIRDLNGREDYVPVHARSRSAILIPLTSHGKTKGLLVAEATEIDRFRERDEQLLTVVGRSAALALENAELHKRTEELTSIDELTDTFNYRYFVRKLQEEKKRAVRYSLPLSLIMVDIDWFKKLNDAYGHEVGNLVLRQLSRIIKDCVRDVDIFARYGGEEFAIILPQTPEQEARVIGERIRAQVERTILDAGAAGKLKITVSVGISSFPENGKSQEELVSIADQALYRAKGSGKNLVCVA